MFLFKYSWSWTAGANTLLDVVYAFLRCTRLMVWGSLHSYYDIAGRSRLWIQSGTWALKYLLCLPPFQHLQWTQKNSNPKQYIQRFLSRLNLYILLVWWQSSSLSTFEPLQIIWKLLLNAIPELEDNRRFWPQKQWLSSQGSCSAPKTRQGVSKSVQSMKGSVLQWQASLKKLQQYWLSLRVKLVLVLGCNHIFFFFLGMDFRWISQEHVTDQNSAHWFTQSSYHSLVSE